MKEKSKLLNLIIILSSDKKKILLGMKRRGFGKGRWNGFGGKVEENESIEDAAERELFEEIKIKPLRLEQRGILTFYEADPNPLRVHIFSCDKFKGKPIKTEEMRPKWFDVDKIPYEDMWPDDKYWLPLLLRGKNFSGNFWFKNKENTDKITRYELKQIDI